MPFPAPEQQIAAAAGPTRPAQYHAAAQFFRGGSMIASPCGGLRAWIRYSLRATIMPSKKISKNPPRLHYVKTETRGCGSRRIQKESTNENQQPPYRQSFQGPSEVNHTAKGLTATARRRSTGPSLGVSCTSFVLWHHHRSLAFTALASRAPLCRSVRRPYYKAILHRLSNASGPPRKQLIPLALSQLKVEYRSACPRIHPIGFLGNQVTTRLSWLSHGSRIGPI